MDRDNPEIAKLVERISKDPKSKLFVPLAEEYKKAGDIEKSIHVLMEGLKNNPGYVTARSFLGRLLFDKGDMAGAQREFEEVAKSIPDNLMAQHKLGDLYVLQNRPTDALKHYKIALSLNPGDEEMAVLVSDIEAGRDVKERLLTPKQPTGEKRPTKEEPAQSASIRAQMKPHPAPIVAKQSEPIPTPVPSAMESEEPEEVLVVEPLEFEGKSHEESAVKLPGHHEEEVLPEPGKPVEKELPAVEFDFLSEKGSEAEKTALPEEPAVMAFDTAEPRQDKSSAVADIVEASLVETEAAAKIPEASSEKSDDFTTDTLAELYIAQGFYEKAIDIYQRMLTDNPDNQKLKDKLTRVRAMASEAEPPAELKIEVKETRVTNEEVIFLGGPEQPPETESDQKLTTGPGDYILPAAEETKEVMPPERIDVGPESGEHAPPQVTETQPVETKTPHVMKSPAASRKETIERLESWLKNIMKEK
jgi:tetratricopeptide (TPR) repeat protein